MAYEQQEIRYLLADLWKHVGPKRRKQFCLLLCLMLLVSIAEILSIGAVLPFLAVISEPQRVLNHRFAGYVAELFGFKESQQLLLPLTLIFCSAALAAGLMRFLLLWVSMRLSFATGHDLSVMIYERTLHQPYRVHVSRNSSEIIGSISSKVNLVIFQVISPVLVLLSNAVIAGFIVSALLLTYPHLSATIFLSLVVLYSGIIVATRRPVSRYGQRVAEGITLIIKQLQEGLGSIRDILLDGNQNAYCDAYCQTDKRLRDAQAANIIIGASPRYGIEALGMVAIASVAYAYSLRPGGTSKVIPALAVLALGAQRLLPLLQHSYVSIVSIRHGKAALSDTLHLLNQSAPSPQSKGEVLPMSFEAKISLEDVSFSYGSEHGLVLRNINFEIPKGSRIGIIGTTGSGKSTLLDVVMGLLEPTSGALKIDGIAVSSENRRAWQAHLAHVPQSIFLADSSIEENIAFGLSERGIDVKRVREAAKKAQLADVIESWPETYRTTVGERGVRLSGGQRQRIGIARALYKKADVIVFDEATSALDSDTEEAVMDGVDALDTNLTVLIIAHRLTTLRNCTKIVELKDGSICRVGTYSEIVEQAPKHETTHNECGTCLN